MRNIIPSLDFVNRLPVSHMLSLLVLSFPTCLFFIGWFEPWISCLFLLFLLVYFVKGSTVHTPWPQSIVDVRKFALISVAVLLYLSIGGLLGYFPTHGDSCQLRQAMFINMRDAAWPLILPNGKEMSYYIAGMLPPAFFARLLPNEMGQWSVLLCTAIPPLMALWILYNKFGHCSWLYLLLFIAFQDPLCSVFRPSGTIIPGRGFMAGWLDEIHGMTGIDMSILVSYYGNKTIGACLHNCIGAYNSTPYTLLAVSLLLCARDCRWLPALIVALLAPISPMGAIACAPIASYLYLKHFHWASCWLELALPCLVAVCSFLYFFRAERTESTCSFDFLIHGKDFFIFYSRYLCGAALLVGPLLRRRWRDGLFRVTVLTMILIPLVFIGSPPSERYQGFNELTLKGTFVFSLILSCMWFEDWKYIRKPIRIIAVVWLIASVSVYCIGQIRHFSWEHRVDDMWNGHLNHGNRFLNQSVPPTRDPILKGVLIRVGGGSEVFFPGCMLPKARGCDYSLPCDPDAFP